MGFQLTQLRLLPSYSTRIQVPPVAPIDRGSTPACPPQVSRPHLRLHSRGAKLEDLVDNRMPWLPCDQPDRFLLFLFIYILHYLSLIRLYYFKTAFRQDSGASTPNFTFDVLVSERNIRMIAADTEHEVIACAFVDPKLGNKFRNYH